MKYIRPVTRVTGLQFRFDIADLCYYFGVQIVALLNPPECGGPKRGIGFAVKNSEVQYMPTVLVVDDDDTIRDALYEFLSEEYVCHTAETAEKAFTRLQGDAYDVVLTDILMPRLSGLQLLCYVRQKFP